MRSASVTTNLSTQKTREIHIGKLEKRETFIAKTFACLLRAESLLTLLLKL